MNFFKITQNIHILPTWEAKAFKELKPPYMIFNYEVMSDFLDKYFRNHAS